jgi:hypothetical protein
MVLMEKGVVGKEENNGAALWIEQDENCIGLVVLVIDV